MKGRIYNSDAGFPKKLKDFAEDVKEIYFDGNMDLMNKICTAVVGSRKATQYGKTVSEAIGKKLGENGVVTVSGLAKGIDTSALRGAMKAGGKVIAVLGNGTERYYPPSNKDLQMEIAEKGLLISEYPPDFEAKPYTFPKRNRIISAVSESVVIVEAGNRSGALITAECAAEQGKNLYAVPGNITSYYSFGTNKLIRENITPLILIDDLITDLGIEPYINEKIIADLSADEESVYRIVKERGEISINEIYHRINKNPWEINGIITILEMKGIIFTSLGKVFVAKF